MMLNEYNVLSINDDIITNDIFQEQSCENNTMEEPSVLEETIILEYAYETSTTATDLINDKATKLTTLGANFCSQDEITRITNDPDNHPNIPDDAEIELKSLALHMKIVDVTNENKLSVVIFVDLAVKQKERLLQEKKRLDSNSFDNIVGKKVKCMHICFLLLI